MSRPSLIPKFSWTKALGISRFASRRVSGCSLCPPLWIIRSEERSWRVDRRIVQQPDQQRGHHLQMRHAVFLDQRAHVFRLGAGADHDFAPLEKKSLDPGAGQRQVVRDGQNEQQNRIAVISHTCRGDFGIVGVVVVRARNQLGNARGAAGKLKHGADRWDR